MKKLAKYVYVFKVLLFIVDFYFVFIMLNNILDTKIYGIIFLTCYLIFAVKILLEILSKKIQYQRDIIYNFMQIGFMLYFLIVAIKIHVAKVYVTRITINYFKTNYIILSILVMFILIYGYLEFKSSKK